MILIQVVTLMSHRKWTDDELESLSTSYPTCSWPQLEQSFRRSEGSIRSKAARLGIERAEIDLTEVMKIREKKEEQGLLIDL